jgi:hypothetical protein
MLKESNNDDRVSKVISGNVKTLLYVQSEHCDNEGKKFP